MVALALCHLLLVVALTLVDDLSMKELVLSETLPVMGLKLVGDGVLYGDLLVASGEGFLVVKGTLSNTLVLENQCLFHALFPVGLGYVETTDDIREPKSKHPCYPGPMRRFGVNAVRRTCQPVEAKHKTDTNVDHCYHLLFVLTEQ
jgi:hypothetical protein